MSADLSTRYLNLQLKNPVIMAASPLTAEIHQIERFADAGVSAAVLTSVFEEHIDETSPRECDDAVSPGRGFGGIGSFTAGPDAYLRQIAAAKKCVSIPIIASLNVSTADRWVRFAELIEGAGADALELNVYFVPTDPTVSGLEVEARYTEIVSAVRSRIKIPLAVKLGPYFSSLPHLAGQLIGAGVNGLVLFNRYLQPEISLATYEVSPHLTLSTSEELRLPLRWVGILRDQVSISLAVTGGVHTGEDVVRSILAGADATMLASALLRHGPSLVPMLLAEVETWLAARGFGSVAAIRGLASFHRGKNASNYERANYADALAKFTQSDGRVPACLS